MVCSLVRYRRTFLILALFIVPLVGASVAVWGDVIPAVTRSLPPPQTGRARVALVRTDRDPNDAEIDAMVRQAIGLALGEPSLESLIAPADTVVIKPNLGGGSVDRWELTDWQVVRPVVELAQAAGAGRVVLVEGINSGTEPFERGNYLAQMPVGVEYANFDDLSTALYQVSVTDGIWSQPIVMPQLYIDADVVISVPAVKTHDQTGVTLSLKNAMGIPPSRFYATGGATWRNQIHAEIGLQRTIVQENLARAPDFTVVDGIQATEGQGPWGGTPLPLRLVAAGRDPVAVDTVLTRVMGQRPDHVAHIVFSAAKNLGIADPARIDVVGATITETQRSFALPAASNHIFRAASVARPLSAAITLDGDPSEWVQREQMHANRTDQVTGSGWVDAADGSAVVQAAWDSAGLWLAAWVHDDAARANSRSAIDIPNGDGLSLFFSGDIQWRRGRSPNYSSKDFQLATGYGQSGVVNLRAGGAQFSGAQVAWQPTGQGYTAEIFLPWSALGDYQLTPNLEFGFDVALNDEDPDGVAHLLWGAGANLATDVMEMGMLLPTSADAIPSACAAADLNHDGRVGVDDVQRVASFWLQNKPEYDFAGNDGRVTAADIMVVASQFGEVCGAGERQ